MARSLDILVLEHPVYGVYGLPYTVELLPLIPTSWAEYFADKEAMTRGEELGINAILKSPHSKRTLFNSGFKKYIFYYLSDRELEQYQSKKI